MVVNIAVRNHYLPQFYLEAFRMGTNSSVFWVYDKLTHQLSPQSPINTGVKSNLYNLEKADGSIDDSLETEFFSQLDGFSAEAVRRLLPSDARLGDEDIAQISGFVAFMATRIPRSIQVAQEIGNSFAAFMALQFSKKPKEIEKALSELQGRGELGEDLTVEQAQKMLSSMAEKSRVTMNPKAAMVASISCTDAILRQLLRMNWCLCRAQSRIEFITGDAPLVCFVLEPDGQALLGAGYACSNAEVTLPLSPNKCLYLSHKHNQCNRAVSEKVVKKINKRTAWAAERFIIAGHKTKYVGELLKWGSKTVEHPKTDRAALYRLLEREEGLFD